MKAEEFKKKHNWELIYDIGEIEMFEDYAKLKVIEDLELILDRTKLAVNLESIRGHIESQIKLKQE